MKTNSKARLRPANLFFIELIVILLFFSFSAAVILGIFAAADHRQKHSNLVENALICSQSIAEAFAVTGDFTEAAEIVFGGDAGVSDGHIAEIRLDDNMMPCEDGEIILSMLQNTNETEAGRLSCLEFEFRTNKGKLFSPVICEAYFPTKGGVADE